MNEAEEKNVGIKRCALEGRVGAIPNMWRKLAAKSGLLTPVL